MEDSKKTPKNPKEYFDFSELKPDTFKIEDISKDINIIFLLIGEKLTAENDIQKEISIPISYEAASLNKPPYLDNNKDDSENKRGFIYSLIEEFFVPQHNESLDYIFVTEDEYKMEKTSIIARNIVKVTRCAF